MINISNQKIRIGQEVKKAREKKGISQAEVAKLVKLHSNYYARIERGDANPTLDTLFRIVALLEMSSLDILRP